MATFVMDCPHCQTKSASMITFGSVVYPIRFINRDKKHASWPVAISAACSICSDPIVVKAWPLLELSGYGATVVHASTINGNLSPLEDSHLMIDAVWPEPPTPEIPAAVTAEIERAMLQAERNYPTVGNEEAAAVMYRRALELALKDKATGLKGTLADRIKKMVASHALTPAIGEWADEIRSLGNDAAHDEGDIDRTELSMIRGFTDAVLRYLYTLPAEVAARRKVPASVAE